MPDVEGSNPSTLTNVPTVAKLSVKLRVDRLKYPYTVAISVGQGSY